VITLLLLPALLITKVDVDVTVDRKIKLLEKAGKRCGFFFALLTP
jgi:hypothetical protein